MAEELNRAILLALLPESTPISLPRLGKRLGLGVSVLMRALTMMGKADIAGHAGPGWVQMDLDEDRWMVQLTDTGRRLCAEWVDA